MVPRREEGKEMYTEDDFCFFEENGPEPHFFFIPENLLIK